MTDEPLYKQWKILIREFYKIDTPQHRCLRCDKELTDEYSRSVGFGSCCIEHAKANILNKQCELMKKDKEYKEKSLTNFNNALKERMRGMKK